MLDFLQSATVLQHVHEEEFRIIFPLFLCCYSSFSPSYIFICPPVDQVVVSGQDAGIIIPNTLQLLSGCLVQIARRRTTWSRVVGFGVTMLEMSPSSLRLKVKSDAILEKQCRLPRANGILGCLFRQLGYLLFVLADHCQVLKLFLQLFFFFFIVLT